MPAAEIQETSGPGDGERLARQAVEEGVDTLVGVGGDGSLHELVNGIAPRFDAIRLGLIPLGTGNDFSRSVSVSDTPREAVETLLAGEEKRVDVVRIEARAGERYALNGVSGGFAALVSEKVDSETKERLGIAAYVVTAGRSLPDIVPSQLHLTIDDEEIDVESYAFIVLNGRTIGGGLPLAPEARLDDGRADLLVIPTLGAARLAAVLPLVLLGQHGDHEELIRRRARRIVVEADPPMSFNSDGEPWASTPATFEVLSRRVRFLVGPA
jgi:diacylglycerol kinase (ATP)